MGRQLGKVPCPPPALPQGFTSEPSDRPHDIHRGGIQQPLEMRACQPKVPTPAEVKAPGALREATLGPRPQSVLDFEGSRRLPSACDRDGLMVRPRLDGELAWSAFRRGARRTGGTRATSGSIKPNANHGIARDSVSRPPVDAGMAVRTARLQGRQRVQPQGGIGYLYHSRS
jgi:hypothetical protein